jgi:pyruvate dehydrogenase E2 component (dihydrolipoamide acetyltransferase)
MRVEVFMPRLGQSMEEGRVLKWLKPVGAKVERGEVIAEIETDKATVDLEALVTGTVVEIMGVEGEIVPIGTAIAIIDDGKPEPETKPTKEPEVEIVSETELEEKTLSRPLTTLTTSPSKRVKASPAARSMAEEHGVDLRQVQASNPERFINKADVEAYLARREAEPTETELRPRRLSVSPVARQLADEHEVE